MLIWLNLKTTDSFEEPWNSLKAIHWNAMRLSPKFLGCWRGVAFLGSGCKMVHTVQRRVVSLELLVILVSNWNVFGEGRKGEKNCKHRVEGT